MCNNPHLILSFDLLDASSTFYPSADKMSPDMVSCPHLGVAILLNGSQSRRLSPWSFTRLGWSLHVIAMGKPRLSRQACLVGFPLDCYIAA